VRTFETHSTLFVRLEGRGLITVRLQAEDFAQHSIPPATDKVYGTDRRLHTPKPHDLVAREMASIPTWYRPTSGYPHKVPFVSVTPLRIAAIGAELLRYTWSCHASHLDRGVIITAAAVTSGEDDSDTGRSMFHWRDAQHLVAYQHTKVRIVCALPDDVFCGFAVAAASLPARAPFLWGAFPPFPAATMTPAAAAVATPRTLGHLKRKYAAYVESNKNQAACAGSYSPLSATG